MSGGGDGERPIIIVVKKVGGHGGHHGGSWKVAIADLMTAMMALFMVLWLIGQSPKTRAAVGAYFRDPLGLAGGGNTDVTSGPLSGGSGFFSGGNTALSQDMMISPGAPSVKPTPSTSSKRELAENKRSRERLAQALLKLRQQDWARHLEMTAVEEGLRIEMQDTEEGSLFAPGSSTLNPKFEPMLREIAQEVGVMPNKLVIEGHTDSARNSKEAQQNWEISAQRANAARRFLVEAGIRNDQVIEVRGYADRRLRLWHDPRNPRNRRVSLLVLLERGKSIEPPNVSPPPEHELDKALGDLDAREGAPRDVIEMAPGGQSLPPTPSKGPAELGLLPN
jgi:chemotaxis protein MotB